jgi:hypothetical protein
MVKHSNLQPGMVVTFDRSSVDINRWKELKGKSMRSPNYTNAEDWYRRTLGKFENVPIEIKGYRTIADDGDGMNVGIKYTQELDGRTVDGNKSVDLDKAWFDPKNVNAFKQVTQPKPEPASGTGINAIRALRAQNQGGRKTRKGRKGKKTRRTRKH